MRDPNRIDRILSALGTYWHANPNHRLGQIIVNLTGVSDPYHVEDDATEAALGAAIAPTIADPEVVAAEVAVQTAHRRWRLADAESAAATSAERFAKQILSFEEHERDMLRADVKRYAFMAGLAIVAALSFAWVAPRTPTPTTPPSATPARVP